MGAYANLKKQLAKDDLTLQEEESGGLVHLWVEMPDGNEYGSQHDTRDEAAKVLREHLAGNGQLGEDPDPYAGMDEFERETAKAQDA